MKNKSKIQSTEPLPNRFKLLNSKESMKTNPYGPDLNHNSKKKIIENSIKTCSKILVNPSNGLISLQKDKPSLQDYFSYPKEHLMINLKSFMRKSQKWSYMYEKS